MKFLYVVGDVKGSDSIIETYLSKSNDLVLDRFLKKHSNIKFSKVSILENDEVDGYKLFLSKKKSIWFKNI